MVQPEAMNFLRVDTRDKEHRRWPNALVIDKRIIGLPIEYILRSIKDLMGRVSRDDTGFNGGLVVYCSPKNRLDACTYVIEDTGETTTSTWYITRKAFRRKRFDPSIHCTWEEAWKEATEEEAAKFFVRQIKMLTTKEVHHALGR